MFLGFFNGAADFEIAEFIMVLIILIVVLFGVYRAR